jgi:hypothetical protein
VVVGSAPVLLKFDNISVVHFPTAGFLPLSDISSQQ